MKRKADDSEPLSPITNTVRPSRKPRLSTAHQDMMQENMIKNEEKITMQENEMFKDDGLNQENTDNFKLDFVEKIALTNTDTEPIVNGIKKIECDACPSKKVPRPNTKDCSVKIIRLDIDIDETIKIKPNKSGKVSDRDKVLRSLGGFCGMGSNLAHLLDEEDQEAADKVAAFLLFLQERQTIWERRRRDPQCTWEIKRRETLRRGKRENKLTQNNVMAVNFFTNLYRELDKGTVYFRNQICTTDLKERGFSKELDEDILRKVFYKATVYRLLNQINTFKEFESIPSFIEWDKFKKFLNRKRDRLESIFTSAHQSMGLERYIQSIEYLRENLDDLTHNIFCAAEDRSLSRCFQTLTSIPNVGNFLAWQVLCDLLESQTLGRCSENQWTKLGPGAKDGIKKIFGTDLSKTELQYTRLLRDLCALEGEQSGFEALGIQFPALFGHALSLKNIEHALCEFSKYWRSSLADQPSGRKYAVPTPPDFRCCVLCGQLVHVKIESGTDEENHNYKGKEAMSITNNDVMVKEEKTEKFNGVKEDFQMESVSNCEIKTEVDYISKEKDNSSEKTIKRLCKFCTVYTDQWETDYDYEEDEEDPEYEVESIVDHKMVNGDTEYLVKWKGFGHEENTWEPIANLSCADIIDQYMGEVKSQEKISDKNF